MTLLSEKLQSRRLLLGLVALVGTLVALAPLVLVLSSLKDVGLARFYHEVSRPFATKLLVSTIELTICTTLGATALGVATAFALERVALPVPTIWRTLVLLPLAMPDFVVSYTWHSFFPYFRGLVAASFIMSLSTYPLVTLPVMAALRRFDATYYDVGVMLGDRRRDLLRRLTLPLIWPAVLGGASLVALTVLGEYGAFEVLRFHTYTTEIVNAFKFDRPMAVSLCWPLLGLALIVLVISRAPKNSHLASRHTPRRVASATSVGKRLGAAAFLLVTIALGVVVPCYSLTYWLLTYNSSTLPARVTVWQATWTTVVLSLPAALVCVVVTLPIAWVAARYRTLWAKLCERAVYLTRSLPGVVVALGLLAASLDYLYFIYQTRTLLIIGYVILSMPLALVCLNTSIHQLNPRLEEVGVALGRPSWYVTLTVTLPLLAPGIGAAMAMVFLTTATDLTTTLMMAPPDTVTLATQFWAFQSEGAYAAAARYALVLIVMAAAPAAVLATWFDRKKES